MNNLKDIIRFLTKINHTGNCWEWKASKVRGGYGMFCINNKQIMAHRYSYQIFKEEIPLGLDLDHLCRNPSCVNPEHLEPVTHKENLMRGISFSALNLKKTHCPKGHELINNNLMKYEIKRGNRGCRLCYNEYMKLYDLRKRHT